jgi:hypothetical protein
MKASRLFLICCSFACAVLLLAALLARPEAAASQTLFEPQQRVVVASPTPGCCQNGVSGSITSYCEENRYRYTYGITNTCAFTVTANGGLFIDVSPNSNGPWTSPLHVDYFNTPFGPGYTERSGSMWSGPLPPGNYWWRMRLYLGGNCWSVNVSSTPQLACVGSGTPPPTMPSTHTPTTGPTSVPPTHPPLTSTRTATTIATLTTQPTPRCDVAAWRPVPNPLGGTLHDVEAIASDDVWAVGENGVMHWDGDDWSVTSVPVTETLHAVSAAAPDDVWAGGYRTFVHWDGAAWSQMPFPPSINGYVLALDARAPNDVWAVGHEYTGSIPFQITLVLHWDGVEWTRIPSPNPFGRMNSLAAVDVVAANEVWVVGNGLSGGPFAGHIAMRWDGSQWSDYSSNTNICGLNGVEADSSTVVWAVGRCPAPNQSESAVYRYDGGVWGRITVPDVGTLNGISVLSDSDAWAVGERGALHWDGNTWTAVDTPHQGLQAVSGVAPDDVWAVGEQGVMHYTPALFNDVPPGHTFYPFIQCLACRGIASGYADGTFRPGNNVTRGQLSKIVANAAGFTEPVIGQTFEDVPPDSPFYVFIERLSRRGHIGGYPCGGPGEPCMPPTNRPYFRPQLDTTRGQVAKIACTAWGCQEAVTGQTYQDVPPDNPFYIWIERLSRRGIMSGYPCSGVSEPCVPPNNRPYFRWANTATRGQVSKIVANTFYPGCEALR